MKFKTYPKMKDSGIHWIREIPDDWKIEPLKFHAKINEKTLDGKTDPKLEFSYIDIGSVHSDGTIDEPEKLIFEDAPSRARRIIHENDTIISTVRTYLKAISFIDKTKDNHICSTGFAVITPPNTLDSKFFYWYLSSPNFVETIMANSVGVTYPAINALKLGRFPCMLPRNKQEQKLISKFLDDQTSKIDSDIQKNQKLIKLLKEKRHSTINNAVTKGLDPTVSMKYSGIKSIGEIPEHWKIYRLKHYTTKISSGVTPKGGAEMYENHGIPLIRSQNVHFDGLHLDDVAYINEEIYLKMNRTQLQDFDVLLNITGASIGRCTYVPKNFGKGNVNQHVCIIRTKPKLYFAFLQKFLESDLIQTWIQVTQVGASREGLTFDEIGGFSIPIFDEIEQKQIVDFLDKEITKIDSLISKSEFQIKKLQEYRQSLISNAVTGKICLTN